MESNIHIPEEIAGLAIGRYNYDLPEAKIARFPLQERDQSKLLFWKNGQIKDALFRDLSEYLPPQSLLIFNNTKVIRARLYFRKKSGAKIEIFCLDPYDPVDYQFAFQTTQTCVWKCMVGNRKRWKGECLLKNFRINDTDIELRAELADPERDISLIRFSWNDPNFEFAKIIEHAGILPIPPYLNRETEESDLTRYQTVYSKIKGSVAAPTAGLHFTEDVFESLKSKGHQLAELTLHVGAGTFQPVKSQTISGHEMHSEHFFISRELVEQLLNHSGKLVAVGTTSVRTLESLYWLGVHLLLNPEITLNELKVSQWEAYQKPETSLPKEVVLKALIHHLDTLKVAYLAASTQIIIVPGYQFRIVDGMITNFHQPQSTLLLLISAYLGNEWIKIYEHALANDYRFLSYGDSNLYLNDNH